MPNSPPAPGYAELHCLSNFSFQRGASTARELFERAQRLGYRALAITDECTLAGIVRAYEAARETGVALVVGAEFALCDGPRIVLLVEDAGGYSNLCRLVTHARRAAEKGEYRLAREDLEAHPREGLLALLLSDTPKHRLSLPRAGADPVPSRGGEQGAGKGGGSAGTASAKGPMATPSPSASIRLPTHDDAQWLQLLRLDSHDLQTIQSTAVVATHD